MLRSSMHCESVRDENVPVLPFKASIHPQHVIFTYHDFSEHYTANTQDGNDFF